MILVEWQIGVREPVEIFSKRIEREPFYKDYGEFHLLAKDGEVLIPAVKNEEPLKRQAEHFMNAILHRTQPIADGKNALEVVETLTTRPRPS